MESGWKQLITHRFPLCPNAKIARTIRATMKRLFFQALICATYLLAAGVNADDSALEQRLNDVYTQLRRTLTPLEKEALKQEELHWLNERDRFPRGNPRRTELTEERVRVLQTRLSGAAAQQQQITSASASPDGQYAVTARPSSDGGQGDDIDLTNANGKLLLNLTTAARYGFKAYWSSDSQHLVVFAPGKFSGRMRDTFFLVQKAFDDWKTVNYTIRGGAEKVTFLGWASAGAARLRSDGIDVTMDFQEPTKFVFLLGRFADLTLETRQGSERVTYESGNKQGSETLFDLPVTLTAPMTWETRKGTRFHLQKLDHPVINDANRKINSGDWKVIVSGQGDEYNSIMRDLGEPSFGDTGKTEYYGEIDLEATNK
jgi:hypothetical protein